MKSVFLIVPMATTLSERIAKKEDSRCNERPWVEGSFIGKKEWVDTQITERLGEMEKNGPKKILVLQQEDTRLGQDKVIQKALHLLRLCYAPSVITHLLRTIPPSIMRPHARRFDNMAYEALRQILGDRSDHTEINTLRGLFISKAVQLSPKDGGFGLTSAEDLSPYAYMSSFLLVGKAVKDMYDRFMPVINEEAKDYFPELHELIEIRGLLKDVPEFKDLKTSDIFNSCELHAQKRIMVKIRPSQLQNVLNFGHGTRFGVKSKTTQPRRRRGPNYVCESRSLRSEHWR
jgi:hypothetical protein